MTTARHLHEAWNIYFSQRQNPSWAFKVITNVEQHWIIQKLKKIEGLIACSRKFTQCMFQHKENRTTKNVLVLTASFSNIHTITVTCFPTFGLRVNELETLGCRCWEGIFFIRIKYYTLPSPAYRTRTFGVCAPKWLLCDVQNRKAFEKSMKKRMYERVSSLYSRDPKMFNKSQQLFI